MTNKERITEMHKKGQLLNSSAGFVDIMSLHEDYFIAGFIASGKQEKMLYSSIGHRLPEKESEDHTFSNRYTPPF